MAGTKRHPLARRIQHLHRTTVRAAETFGQISSVLARAPRAPRGAWIVLLETIGQLHTEITAWRRHFAVLAVRAGLSQRVVAEALQVSRRTIQIWISDTEQQPTPMQEPRNGSRAEGGSK